MSDDVAYLRFPHLHDDLLCFAAEDDCAPLAPEGHRPGRPRPPRVRAYFWEPGMGGVDWTAVLDQYRPLVERVASPDEFADLLREVMGELGTSHAYVTPARRNEGPPHYQRPMGLLGANLGPGRPA
ncbi:hypothetical protein STANM309S_03348 [Streptomyces tanashiensis]